jgi:NADH:ubiquinone oxidoreductase subunit E
MEVESKKLQAIVGKYKGDKAYILSMFQDVQKLFRYLPKDAVKYICQQLKIPFAKGYEVATFYKSFSLNPRGKHTVHVCLGTACHLRGAPTVMDTFERELQLKVGQTTADGSFTLESVNCLGACALAPLVRVDEQNFGKTTPAGIKTIIGRFRDEQQS